MTYIHAYQAFRVENIQRHPESAHAILTIEKMLVCKMLRCFCFVQKHVRTYDAALRYCVAYARCSTFFLTRATSTVHIAMDTTLGACPQCGIYKGRYPLNATIDFGTYTHKDEMWRCIHS